jgi:hypothetical protein
MTAHEKIAIELSPAEALVLFEFLSRFSSDGSLKVVDPAEERVLWDVCTTLESALAEPLAEDYPIS